MLATKREAQAPLLSSSSDEDLNVCARPQDVSGSGSFYGSFPENPMQLRSRLCDENRASEMDLSAANEDLNTSDPRIAILDHDYRCPETINEFDGTWTTPSSPSESITSPVSNTSRSGAGCSPSVKSPPSSTCSSASNQDGRYPWGFNVHAQENNRRSPAKNKLSKPSCAADDCVSIKRYPQKYPGNEFNRLHLVETRGCQTQRDLSHPMTAELTLNSRKNIFTPIASKTKLKINFSTKTSPMDTLSQLATPIWANPALFRVTGSTIGIHVKRLPFAMRLRRLPKSYWEEPAGAKHTGTETSTVTTSPVSVSSSVNPHSSINFSTYTILPPLFSSGKNDFAAEEILGTGPISPIVTSKNSIMSQISFPGHNGGGGGTAQSQVTAVNSDLLASLFDSVTKEKPAKDISNQSTSYSFIGAKKHDTNSRKTITSSICNGKNQLTRKQLDKPGRRVPELKGNDPLLIEAAITESLLPSLTIETSTQKCPITNQNAFNSNSIHL